MTDNTMWPPQTTATVFDILRHIRSTSPSTCYWCKEEENTVAVLAQHIHSCWVIHRTDLIRND